MVVSKGKYHPIDSMFGVSEHKLGFELWAMKEKVSDPYPPSPNCSKLHNFQNT